MPRGYNRYDFVVDNGNFNPYQSMTEMLVPFQAYKEVFDKEQERVLDYGKKASVFKYLADRLPEDSQAARIYQGYMKDFEEEAKDFTKNGRTALNSRNLLDLWRRYDNEIGQLELAEKNRQKEFDKRMANKDTSMLYATDVLDIDDFIGNNSPNLYSVSGNALYTKGAALGKAISDREVTSGDNGSVLGKYYRNWKETQGVRNSDIGEFINRSDVQEELQRYMKAEGLDNLTGANRERAEQQLLSGFYTGIEYSEKNNLHRDLGVMTAQEKAQNARAEKEFEMKKEKWEREKREIDATFNARFIQDTNEDGSPKEDEEGNPVYIINPNYLKGTGYTYNPVTGKPVKDGDKDGAAAKIEKAASIEKGDALKNLESKTLKNNSGFDVTFGGKNGVEPDTHHYDYVGALSKHGGDEGIWYSGKLGTDNPGHGLWGMGSTSNVENAWGTFSAEGASEDEGKAHVLRKSEIEALYRDSKIANEINGLIQQAGYYNDSMVKAFMEQFNRGKKDSEKLTEQDTVKALNEMGLVHNNDVQIVGIPNEWPNKEQMGYLVAVRTR